MSPRSDGITPLARLLVVDDLVMLRKGVRILLEDAGYEVDEAGSGEEALELFKNKQYDLVMTDLSMPGMGGIEWVRKVAPPREGRPVILMLTAKVNAKEMAEARSIGVRDIMAKPYRRDALLAKIEELLEIDRKTILAQRAAAAHDQRSKERTDREKKKKAAPAEAEKKMEGQKPDGNTPAPKAP